ncbi:hypothetical protein TEQG_08443 [Trichophyton equinum CBS 127.97]|uniref:Uncharacterized protein n=1 Tax=Trichophyton equinum (strain ATCC MYA-4606 / CBS 127.97) TaxID=559882 RepID=F2Q5U6_TRIEC|nr:hypothetical protein TEQG_08443 [Trichophyton equinum CBS 127.97]
MPRDRENESATIAEDTQQDTQSALPLEETRDDQNLPEPSEDEDPRVERDRLTQEQRDLENRIKTLRQRKKVKALREQMEALTRELEGQEPETQPEGLTQGEESADEEIPR